jgi:hypothetical protein
MKFLYAAYAATWLIHIAYLAIIGGRFRHLREQMEEWSKQRGDPRAGSSRGTS